MGGTDVAMLVNSATFVAVAVAALLLRARRPPQPAPEDGEPDRARDGVVYLFRDRALGLVMSVVFVSLLFMTASATAEVFFIKEDLQVSDALYGLLFGAWTCGMVAGALVVSRRIPATAPRIRSRTAADLSSLAPRSLKVNADIPSRASCRVPNRPARRAALANTNADEPEISVRSRSKNAALGPLDAIDTYSLTSVL